MTHLLDGELGADCIEPAVHSVELRIQARDPDQGFQGNDHNDDHDDHHDCQRDPAKALIVPSIHAANVLTIAYEFETEGRVVS